MHHLTGRQLSRTLGERNVTPIGWVFTTIGQVTGQITTGDECQVIRGNVEVHDGFEILLNVVGAQKVKPETLSGRQFESVVVDLGDERFRKSVRGRRERWTWERHEL